MDVADVGKDALYLDALDIHLVLLHLRAHMASCMLPAAYPLSKIPTRVIMNGVGAVEFKIQRVLCSFEPTLFKSPRVERRRGIRLGICSIFCGNLSRIG